MISGEQVTAHVSHNSVAVGDVASLVKQVHGALAGLGEQQPADTGPAKREPVVTVRSSVKPEALTCLLCGSKQSMLKRHLATAHDMTPADYRAEFDLKADYPMVAPNYAEKRRDLAMRIGLGRKKAPEAEKEPAPSPAAAPAPAKRGRPKRQPSAEA